MQFSHQNIAFKSVQSKRREAMSQVPIKSSYKALPYKPQGVFTP